MQGSQEQEVKFQHQIFNTFPDNFKHFVGFTRRFFLCSQILISQVDQYCSHENVTKAMLHIKQ